MAESNILLRKIKQQGYVPYWGTKGGKINNKLPP
jgi:hypothetical protein